MHCNFVSGAIISVQFTSIELSRDEKLARTRDHEHWRNDLHVWQQWSRGLPYRFLSSLPDRAPPYDGRSERTLAQSAHDSSGRREKWKTEGFGLSYHIISNQVQMNAWMNRNRKWKCSHGGNVTATHCANIDEERWCLFGEGQGFWVPYSWLADVSLPDSAAPKGLSGSPEWRLGLDGWV